MDFTPITIDAVYSDGALRPLGEVKLVENQHVRLTIAPVPVPPSPAYVAEWLARTAAHRQEMFAESGYCYDSTEIIAAGRRCGG